MPKRISRDGSQVDPHCIKLEEMYQHIFDWFKKNVGFNKTDVIRKSVEEYFTKHGGDLSEMISKGNVLKRDLYKDLPEKCRSVSEYIIKLKPGKIIHVSAIRSMTNLNDDQAKLFLRLLFKKKAIGKDFNADEDSLFYYCRKNDVDDSFISDACKSVGLEFSIKIK